MKKPYLDVSKIPADLKAKPQWFPWKFLLKETANGERKYRKPPCSIETQKPIDAMKRDNWYTFEDALDALCDNPDVFHGIGYIFDGGEEFGIDFDGVVKDGKIDSEVLKLITELGTYSEFSPSGNGVHIISKGSIPGPCVVEKPELKVEWYTNKRFFTFTGNAIPGFEKLIDAQQSALKWYGYYDAIKNASIGPDTSPEVFFGEYNPPVKKTLEKPVKTIPRAPYYEFTGGDGDAIIEIFTSDAKGDTLWNGDYRNKDNSASEYDWMIAKIGLKQRLAPLEIIWLMVQWRERIGEDTTKVTKNDCDYGYRTITRATEFTPPKHLNEPPAEKRRIVSIPLSQFVASYQPVGWRIKDYLPKDALIWVAGKWSSTKTFFVLNMCYCIATGKPWYENQCKPASVSYVVGEGKNSFILRVQGLVQHHGIPVDDNNFQITPVPVHVNIESQVTELISAYQEQNFFPDVIVFDTKSANMEGSDSDAAIMNAFIEQCRRLQRYYDATIIVVDHTGHENQSRPRGASQQLGATDGAYLIEWDKDLNQGSFKAIKDPKDAITPREIIFKRTIVDVEGYYDEDGLGLTTLILEESDLPQFDPDLYPELEGLAASRIEAFRILYTMYQQHKQTLKDRENGIPRVEQKFWRQSLLNRKVIDKPTKEAERSDFHNIKKALTNANVIEQEGETIQPLIRENEPGVK